MHAQILITVGIILTILMGSGLFGNKWKIFSEVGSESIVYVWATVGQNKLFLNSKIIYKLQYFLNIKPYIMVLS